MLSISDFLAATNGKMLQPGKSTHIESCEIDASRVAPGCAYIAINPAKYDCADGGLGFTGNEDSVFGLGGFDDGHDRIHEALSNGATTIVIEDRVDLHSVPSSVTVLSCPKAIEAVKFVCQARLADSGICVIGVSGCIGKSTVSHLIWSCLNKLEKGSAFLCDRTRTTYLGLAVDILRYVNTQKYLVVELQSDAKGQIPSLISVAPPNISVVTRITNAHLAKLGSKQNIIDEETSPLFESMSGHRRIAILNGDDEYLVPLSSSTWKKRILVGYSERCDLRIRDAYVSDEGTHCRLEYEGHSTSVDLRCIGRHYPFSAAATAAVICEFGQPLAIVARAISQCVPPPGRMELFRGRNEWIVLVDAYNAGFESTLNAVDSLKAIGDGKMIGIIGSMLELGRHCRSEHELLGQELVHRLGTLVTVGEAAYIVYKSAIGNGFPAGDAFHFESVERLICSLDELAFPKGARIVVKGSGALRLERAALHLLRERIA